RPLAHIASSPRSAGVLLESMGYGEMHHRVVHEPGEDRIDGAGTTVGLCARDAYAPRNLAPMGECLRLHRSVIDMAGIFSCESLRVTRIAERTHHREDELVCRGGQQSRISAGPRPGVAAQQLIAADRSDDLRGTRHEVIDRLGIALAPQASGLGAESEALLR